jgi:hypothetical protein
MVWAASILNDDLISNNGIGMEEKTVIRRAKQYNLFESIFKI